MPQKFPRVFYLLAIAFGLGVGSLLGAVLLRAAGLDLDQFVYLVRHRLTRDTPDPTDDPVSPAGDRNASPTKANRYRTMIRVGLGADPECRRAVQEAGIRRHLHHGRGRRTPEARENRWHEPHVADGRAFVEPCGAYHAPSLSRLVAIG